MTKKEKLNLLEELLDIGKDTLSEDTELKDLSEWDSLAGITVIAMFDSDFGKIITSDDLEGFITVNDILDKMD
ncbi:phosphopantetheine-binding protein [Desulfosporosinus sp. BG]|uniref:phosphopantetheine-binding protein n=1 Tax=Desulfosporosinus sp. BG TaxID=1633135 RepID=UPI00083B33BA|nr:phosphopantetheine-binding protein [Desulfosporosinus sp. BG]ODA40007.1 putative acyl carrier protein [Desulfosporosinus sp. BG]